MLDFQIIKQPNGKSRGFAFVTMASGEEAQAVIEKFHSHVSYFGIWVFCILWLEHFSSDESLIDTQRKIAL